MAEPPNRNPIAPQLPLELERHEVVEDLFVDEAVHEGLRLESIGYSHVNAENVELRTFALVEVDLSEAKLDRLDLKDVSIKTCNLANLRSQGCSFDRVQIEGSRLTGAALAESRLVDVAFRDSPIDLSSFRFGRLNRVRFEGCRLIEADFQGVVAKACTFIDCDLTGAQLSQGNFEGSAFRDCRLAEAKGLEALRGAQMAWEDVLELATVLAALSGIEVRDDIS